MRHTWADSAPDYQGQNQPISGASGWARKSTEDEAKQLLLSHAGPDLEPGFLGMLRPYRGLQEESFHEVMTALAALGPSLGRGSTVDRQVMEALWGICVLGQCWGVEPDGMLRRNKLISGDDVERLAQWIKMISWAVFFLIEGSPEAAFEEYKRYCAKHRRQNPL